MFHQAAPRSRLHRSVRQIPLAAMCRVNKEIIMGWLKSRFGEASTMAGLGVIAMVAIPMVPPQYQLLAQGIAVALGLGGVVRPENAK